MELFLLNIYKISKKIATSFCTLLVPESFNLYFILYCEDFRSTILNIRRKGMFKIPSQNQTLYDF